MLRQSHWQPCSYLTPFVTNVPKSHGKLQPGVTPQCRRSRVCTRAHHQDGQMSVLLQRPIEVGVSSHKGWQGGCGTHVESRWQRQYKDHDSHKKISCQPTQTQKVPSPNPNYTNYQHNNCLPCQASPVAGGSMKVASLHRAQAIQPQGLVRHARRRHGGVHIGIQEGACGVSGVKVPPTRQGAAL